MTTPPEGLLFDVAAPPTPVERLLLLADQYVQHNDMPDRRPAAASPSYGTGRHSAPRCRGRRRAVHHRTTTPGCPPGASTVRAVSRAGRCAARRRPGRGDDQRRQAVPPP
ncbi:hypothetical protein EF907_16635 [Streptomyces sp. WAC06273]|nr:hypothetical protein EF907_16635 [Streptomyces sp. WAC06273]